MTDEEFFGAPPTAQTERGLGGIFGSAVSRGWSQNVGLLTEALPALAYSVAGNEAEAQRKLGEYQARLAEIAKTNPAVIESFSKIGSLGDAVTYLAEAVGENLPSMVPGLGGAGLGALAGRTIAKSAAGTAAGMTAGAVAGSAAQNIPETFADVAQETGQQRPGVALAFGGLKAGLDAIPSVMALKRAFGPAITDKIAGNILKRMGVGAAEQFAAEGATEGAQEALDIAASKYVDENREFFTKENAIRIADAGLKGGFGGAALGAATGAIQRPTPAQDQASTPDQVPVLSETHREYLRQMGLSDEAINEDLVRAQTWAERVATRRADDQRRAGFGPEGDWEGMAEDAAQVQAGEMDPGAQRQTGRPVASDEPIVVTPSGAAFPPGDLGAIEGAAAAGQVRQGVQDNAAEAFRLADVKRQKGPAYEAARHYVELTDKIGADPGQLVEQTLQIPAAQFQAMPIPARDRLIQVALEARQQQAPDQRPYMVQDTSGEGPTSAAPAPMREARAAPLAGAAENPMARVQPTSAEIDATGGQRIQPGGPAPTGMGLGGSERPFRGETADSSGLDFSRDDTGKPVDPRAAFFEQRAQAQYETARQQTLDDLLRTWKEREQARAGRGERYAGASDAYSQTRGGERFSNKPKPLDKDSNYPVDQWGFVLSTKGGPMRFADQKEAGLWILRYGRQHSRDQLLDIANHPSGKGFAVIETGRKSPPPGGRGPASYGVPATTNPSPGRPSPAGREAGAAPVAPTSQASGAAPVSPAAPQPAPASPQGPAATKRAEPRGQEGMFSRKKAPGLYSALTDAVESLPMKSAPPAQWQGAINNLTTKGVKQAEIDWSMINDWLGKQTGPVSKGQVLQHLRDNEVQVEEVVRGDGLDAEYEKAKNAYKEAFRKEIGEPTSDENIDMVLSYIEDDGTFSGYFQSTFGAVPSEKLKTAAQNLYEQFQQKVRAENPRTKYDNYTLPGGENYRELLLTLPRKDRDLQARLSDARRAQAEAKTAYQDARLLDDLYDRKDNPETKAARDAWIRASKEADAISDQIDKAPKPYKSSHFDESNIVAHVRFNERTDADGRRVLFIEEIQSDWHQQGKRRGYRLPSTATTAMDAEYRTLVHKNADARNAGREPEPRDVARAKELEAALSKADSSKIPDAPFKTQWPELAFKRALRWAAENGFDRVAWTTGEQQADRYNLSKQVDEIKVSDGGPDRITEVQINTNGGYTIGLAVDKKDGVVTGSNPFEFEGKRLDEIVGKDMADKIMSGGNQTISGGGLKMGGEGMRGFYDKMLPAMASKLGKKYGASVGKANLSQGPRDEIGFVAHSIDITPAMKASVMGRGMPMWAVGKRPSETRAGSPGGESVGATIQQRPETSDQRRQATDSLRAILRKLAGDKIDVKVVDRIIGDDANFADAGGYYTADEGRRIIYIAMANPEDMAAILRHETIHALRDLNIIGPKDWRVLENQAAGWRKKYQTDKYYGGLGLSQEKLNEEAIADAYGDWVQGRYKPTSVVENVFKQIKAFFEALRNWAQGNGWNTANDVFEAIEGGAMSEAEFARAPLTRNNAFAMSRAAMTQRAGGVLDMIKTVRDWADRLQNPLATLPDWESFYEKRGLTKGVIQDIQDGVAKMREIIGLPKEQREAAMRFMATQGASPSMIKDEKQRALFVKAKQQIIDNGQKLVDLGLLPEDVYRQNKGKYLPRMYLKFLLDEDADRRAAGSGAKPSDMGHLKHKKDIPEDIRKILYGEIDDPGFLAARSISVVASDIAKLQLLQDISENSNWVAEPRKQLVEWRGKKYTPQGLKAQADSLRTRIDEMPQDRRDAAVKMADDMDKVALTKLKAQPVFSKDYKQIPDTRRWGSLRGLWVRKEIYDDMQGTFAIPNPDPSWPEQLLGMGGWGTKITQAWKTGKVVLNPPSVIRNLLSGVVQANVLGRVPIRYLPVRYLEAAKDIAAGGKYWQIYHKYGGKGSAYAQNEMARINRDYLALQKAQGTGRVRAMARFKDLVAHIADKASDAYQLVETIGKVSVIIDAMERGKLSERDAMIRAEEAQFDYSNVPPWLRYLRNSPVGVPFACVDHETEVLTQDGWKNIDSVRIGDMAASFDMASEHLCWRPIDDIFTSSYDGEMVHVKDRHLDMLLTPDHRCVTYRRRRVEGKRNENGVRFSLEIQQAQDLKATDHIPVAAPFIHGDGDGSIDGDMAELLGWVAAEGYLAKTGAHILVSQNEGKNADRIRYLLDRVCKKRWRENKKRLKTGSPHVVFYIPADDGRIIRDLLPGKHVTPQLLMRLSVRGINRLLAGLIGGDGSVGKHNGRVVFIQKNGITLEAFQMAMVLTGRSFGLHHRKTAKNPTSSVTIRTGTRYCIKRATRARVHYKGRIWCPSVRGTGTWVARRNGKVFVTHNTYVAKVLPALLKTAVTRPVAFTPYIALAIGLPMLFRHMNDIDMEEWEKLKKVLPEWARQSGVYILPIRDSAGRWHYLDMNYIMPWGMLTQAWNKTVDGKPGDALKGVGLFGAPLFGIATAITTGIDPFTNRPIVQKGDPPWRQYQDTMLYAMGMAMPPWLAFGDVNAGWAKKLWQAANNEAIDRRGNPTSTLTQALGRTVGINLYGLDPEADRQKAIRQKKFEIDEIKRRRGTVAKDQRLKPDEKKEYLDDLNALIREKSVELAEYTRSTNVSPKLRVQAPK